MSTPDSAMAFSWSAKATSAISSVPRIAPTAAPTTNSTRSPGVRMADGPLRLSCPPGGGSVWRCAAKSRAPTVARVKAVTTPEVACPVVDRNVTSTGPTMKTNSSTTDSIASAVGRRWLPRSRWVQRTRIIEDTGGMQAPAMPAERKTVQAGQSSFTAARNPAPETTKTASTGSSTRRWPWLSASRPSTGPASAVVTAPAAATAPPKPYEPVSEATSRTQPSPTIDSGSRPMNAASTMGRACGVRSTCR